MQVFSEIEVQVNYKDARDLFKKAGANVEETTDVVKISQSLVSELIARAPSVVKLCGRADNGDFDCEIGGKRVYMGTGGTALNVQDPGRKNTRPSELHDICDMARLVDALDNIHFFMLNVYPNELPVEIREQIRKSFSDIAPGIM